MTLYKFVGPEERYGVEVQVEALALQQFVVD
jgi:hypothetical protein